MNSKMQEHEVEIHSYETKIRLITCKSLGNKITESHTYMEYETEKLSSLSDSVYSINFSIINIGVSRKQPLG